MCRTSVVFPWPESYRRLRGCAPSPALAGEGRGGESRIRWRQRLPPSEALVGEAADKSAIPAWLPHPGPPPQAGEGAQRRKRRYDSKHGNAATGSVLEAATMTDHCNNE